MTSRSVNEEKPLLSGDGPPSLEAPKSMITPYEPPSTGRNPQSHWTAVTTQIIGLMAGVGVLSIPLGVQQGGWISIPLLVVCAIITNINASLLGSLMMRLPQDTIRDYGSIGGAAFGKAGVRATAVVQYITLGGVSIIFLLLNGILLNGIFPTVPGRFFSLCTGILMIIVLFILPSLREVAWTSYFAALATLAATIVTVIVALLYYYSESYHSHPAHSACNLQFEHDVALKSIAVAFGSFSFSFGGASVLPNLFVEMKHPRHWHRSTTVAYQGVLVVLYIPMAVVGYFVFGNFLGNKKVGNILSAFGLCTPYKIPIDVVSGILVAHLLTAIPIVMTPVCQKVERLFLSKRKRQGRHPAKLFVRFLVICALTLIAMVVPYFLDMISIITAFSVTLAAYVFPALFYWKLRTNVQKLGAGRAYCIRFGLLLIILFGIAGSVFSLVTAIPSLIHDIRCDGDPFYEIFCFGTRCAFGHNCSCPAQYINITGC